MFNYTPEQEEQLFKMAKLDTQITFFVILSLLVLLIIFASVCDIFKTYRQKEYIKTLNDHEKAIITEYRHITPFKRRKEHKC